MNKIQQLLQFGLLDAGAAGVVVEEGAEEEYFAAFGQ